jgi:glycosyltransferase involved in cell wall biosynthesis
MTRPTVSALIPTYNAGHLVVRAIESVLAQSSPASEIVVVDDGSTDDTAERVAAFGESVRYVAQPNAGASAARNLGIASSRGEFVAFLDADDVWHPRKLEAQLEALARHPDLGMLSARTFDWPASGFATGRLACSA